MSQMSKVFVSYMTNRRTVGMSDCKKSDYGIVS
jgi:hypothetical protein